MTMTKLRSAMAQSAVINRRSRCGSVRGWPVVSSHFSPGAAPQVGQRMASICFVLRLPFAMEIFLQNLCAGMLNFEQFLETRRRKKKGRYRSGNAPLR
jgi:hypothetical protein